MPFLRLLEQSEGNRIWRRKKDRTRTKGKIDKHKSEKERREASKGRRKRETTRK